MLTSISAIIYSWWMLLLRLKPSEGMTLPFSHVSEVVKGKNFLLLRAVRGLRRQTTGSTASARPHLRRLSVGPAAESKTAA